MNSFIDIHCHVQNADFPNSIVNLSPIEAFDVLKSSNHNYFSCGIHPWDVHKTTKDDYQLLEEIAIDNRILAIGECGFDKNALATAEKQQIAFEKQISISENVQKPLILHLTGNYPAFFSLFQKYKPKQAWIIHGFRGKPDLAKQLLQTGAYISFGAQSNPKTVEITPVDRICIETDCTQESIEQVYSIICTIKNCKIADIQAPYRIFKQFVC